MNQNDFLLPDEDLAWLKTTFAADQLTVFEQGGHLGNLSHPAVQKAILDALDGLQPARSRLAEPQQKRRGLQRPSRIYDLRVQVSAFEVQGSRFRVTAALTEPRCWPRFKSIAVAPRRLVGTPEAVGTPQRGAVTRRKAIFQAKKRILAQNNAWRAAERMAKVPPALTSQPSLGSRGGSPFSPPDLTDLQFHGMIALVVQQGEEVARERLTVEG